MTVFGNRDADTVLIQMVDDHDLAFIENEVSYIRELTGGEDFCLAAVKVKDWNKDLSPWPAPAVFGSEDFGEGAADTLRYLLEEVLPDLKVEKVHPDMKAEGAHPDMIVEQVLSERKAMGNGKRVFIGGYSLAGLFALWAGYQTDCFDGIAAASPSIWFPPFTDYMKENEIHTGRVYLSLGDREEKTRNPVMATVGAAIAEADQILKGAGCDCVLEWNKGNHFKDADLRTAKAFAWLMK